MSHVISHMICPREEFRDFSEADKVERIIRGMTALKREVGLLPWQQRGSHGD